MTKNGLDIQTISTKRAEKKADRVLLLGQVREKKEKANPSHFLKFLSVDPLFTHLIYPTHKLPVRKTKRVQATSILTVD